MRAFIVAAIVVVVLAVATCSVLPDPAPHEVTPPQATPAADEVAPAGPLTQPARRRAQAVADTPETADAPADAEALRVTVRQADGTLAAGVGVALLSLPGTERSPVSEELAAGVTDAAGVAALAWPAHRSVGRACVHAWTDTSSGIAMLGEERRTDHACVVTLRPARAATVEVVDPDGRPVADAAVSGSVSVTGYNWSTGEFASTRAGTPAGSRPLAAYAGRTDARGRCSFRPLPQGDIDLPSDFWLDPPSASPYVLVEAAGFRSATKALDAATVRVELAPVVEVRALVIDDAGTPIREPDWRCAPDDRGFGEGDGRVLALVPRTPAVHTLVIDADGFVARTFEIAGAGPATVDLGAVVLLRAPMIRAVVVGSDGKPAPGVLVTAEWPGRRFVQGLTDGEGRIALEPVDPSPCDLSAGTPGAPMVGSGRPELWEATARGVLPDSETRLELRYVPAILVELVGPDPRPPDFHYDNVVVVARSADGRAEYDWMPEDHGRRVVRLYGRGPWTLVARHAAIVTAEVELGSPRLGPGEELAVWRMELRAVPAPAGR